MKFKFIGKERKFTVGKWYIPGQIIESDEKPNKYFDEIKSKSKKGDNNGTMES